MRYLRQSTAADVPIGPFVDATDGVTAETALTITQPDVRLKKNAGAWAQKAAAQTLSHEENGFYEVTLDATDTDTLGLLRVAVAESGAAPVWEDFLVITAQEYDRLFTATGQRQLGLVATGTAQSATSTTVVLASGETFADDVPNGMTLVVHGSTQGYSQVRQVTDYVGSTDTATVDAFTVTPSGTITYWLFATPPAVASGTLPAVNTVQISGDSTAADNAEAFFDGTGYAGGTIRLAVNAAQVGGQTASAAGTVTFPGTIASTTNITAAAGCAVSSIGANVITATSIATDAITAAKIAADAIGASELATDAVNEIVAAMFARAFSAAYGSYTFDELVKLMSAVLLGKASGLDTTTATYRNLADNANVVVATVDADGNRTAVTRTP
jgi:hypothetical protein